MAKLEHTPKPMLDRFLSKVLIGDGCWEWTASTSCGYGVFGLQKSRKTTRAHRFMFELLNGKIPDGKCCLHKCDNRRCVNPDHVFLGTRTDNSTDKVRKQREAVGDELPQAKLSLQDVLEIKSLIEEGNLLQREIGAKYGVGQDVISKIKTGVRWNKAILRGGCNG